MCRVSMIGVHGELGECMLIGVIDKLKREGLVRLGLGVYWLAAVDCVGGLGGAGLLCFLSLLRLSSRSCRSCCNRRYCGVAVVELGGGTASSAISGAVQHWDWWRLVGPRHCCGVNSCLFARLCFCFCFCCGLVVVVVVVGVVVVISFVSGVGEGGTHGWAHSDSFLLVVCVVVGVAFVGGVGEGGTHG